MYVAKSEDGVTRRSLLKRGGTVALGAAAVWSTPNMRTTSLTPGAGGTPPPKPPKVDGFCDNHPETALDHRQDDWEEKVKVRLETYDELTKPLLDYYENSGRLKKIDGSGEIEDIYCEIDELI